MLGWHKHIIKLNVFTTRTGETGNMPRIFNYSGMLAWDDDTV